MQPGYGIRQFEIEAIRGKKVDHSERCGMVGGQRETEMASGGNRKPLFNHTDLSVQRGVSLLLLFLIFLSFKKR